MVATARFVQMLPLFPLQPMTWWLHKGRDADIKIHIHKQWSLHPLRKIVITILIGVCKWSIQVSPQLCYIYHQIFLLCIIGCNCTVLSVTLTCYFCTYYTSSEVYVHQVSKFLLQLTGFTSQDSCMYVVMYCSLTKLGRLIWLREAGSFALQW